MWMCRRGIRRSIHNDRGDALRLLGVAFRPGEASRHPLQFVLEGFAVYRPCAAQSRFVHPYGMGRAAGTRACRAQLGGDRAECCGEVIDVPVEANKPLKAGDTLFRIDPVPYDAQVKAIEAQLKLSDLRLAQMTQLYERDSGRAFDVQQRQSE